MTKTPTLKSREVVKALVKAGFIEHRQKGSHKIFKKEGFRVVVPHHQNRDIKKGTLVNIIEQAGLTLDEFMELIK
ncbi:MAG: type II toxin-antitoxin system HicA family toxin [Nitrospinae bacterium]|nr:type II toxin-antitoxin system HicA family toxin [Nitrospinota bacterium]